MKILETYGEILLQQHEGNRQIASALAEGARMSVRRLAKLLAAPYAAMARAKPPSASRS